MHTYRRRGCGYGAGPFARWWLQACSRLACIAHPPAETRKRFRRRRRELLLLLLRRRRRELLLLLLLRRR